MGRWRTAVAVGLAALAVVAVRDAAAGEGPGPALRGQVEQILGGEVVGAINTVALHPTDDNIVYVGAVNGGIWRTNNAMDVNPHWEPLTDAQQSLSIGALRFDPTDATNRTLVAGIGRFSSLAFQGGARTGLLRTIDGGVNWAVVDGGGALNGLNISGVAPRGNTIVIAVNVGGQVGIHRSVDTGAGWALVSGAGTGLTAGASFDLANDPTDPTRLLTNTADGIYRSTDTGANWARVSNAAMDALVAAAGANIRIAFGFANNAYVAICNGGALAGVFRSGNGGTTWNALDLPATVEGGIHIGGQCGNRHMSLAADRFDPNVVYIGGDRQPDPFPNSIGATDFTGRLFRGDASFPPGRQFVHLTHWNTLGAPGGGTATGSAPHADSRDMAVNGDGILIEVDDGGIYRQTNPRANTGDWFSMNGDIRVTELHAVAWDANSNLLLGGAQDTGTPEQILFGNTRWASVSTADGGVVAVDDVGSSTQSIRFSSRQLLGAFERRTINVPNSPQRTDFPALTVLAGGPALRPAFYTPIVINAVQGTRLVIGAANGVYESVDQGDTVTAIAPGVVASQLGLDPIAYGAAGNPDVLYVGTVVGVSVRAAAGQPLAAAAAYPGGAVVGIANDPANPRTAHVADANNVFRTEDAGVAWQDITGNLQALNPGVLRSIAFVPAFNAALQDAVVVGADTGVFRAEGPTFNVWNRFWNDLPTVPVYHLEYDANDGILAAGTLGRGAWAFVDPAILVADFSAFPVRGIAALNVAFRDASRGPNITSWAWDFGDGDASTVQNPNHVYATAGTYTVSLTVTAGAATDTERKVDYITVDPPPPRRGGGGCRVAPGSAWGLGLFMLGVALSSRRRNQAA